MSSETVIFTSHDPAFNLTGDDLATLSAALGDAINYVRDYSEDTDEANARWIERYSELEQRIDAVRLA